MGGINRLYVKYFDAIPVDSVVNGTQCGVPPSDALHLLRGADTADMPWPGNVVGITILSSWYFCSDQVRETVQSIHEQFTQH